MNTNKAVGIAQKIRIFNAVKSVAEYQGCAQVMTLAEIGVRLSSEAETAINAELAAGDTEDAGVLFSVANGEADALIAAIDALAPGWIAFICGVADEDDSARRCTPVPMKSVKLNTHIPLPTASGSHAE
jgi:arginine repressor